VYLGSLIGASLLNSNRFKQIDYLLPLPLYPDKERKRGYNQAEVLCRGIAETMNVPVITGNVIRKRSTETQTRKHRIERWENVEGSFIVTDEKSLEGKHILLVDDVVTTGATLEACGSIIVKIEGARLSVATLSLATK
jgi:ComF family protein